MQILSTKARQYLSSPMGHKPVSTPPRQETTGRVDKTALACSAVFGYFGVPLGCKIGAHVGGLYGRMAASALTSGGVGNPDFFPNLAIGTRIGGVVGGAVLAAVGFAAVTGATYALLKLGDGDLPK